MKEKENQVLTVIKDCSVIYLLVVMITYHLILAQGGEYDGTRVITNFTLHYLIPILTTLNGILFENRQHYQLKSIVYWLIYPMLYTIGSMVRGLFDGFYPYFFLNPHGEIPDGVGNYLNVFIFNIVFLFVFVLLGLIWMGFNSLVSKWKG